MMKKIRHETPTFRTHTLGCKVNIYESEAVNSELFSHGWKLAEDNASADVHIINTCTVTKMSDAKSRKLIRSLIRENPEAIIVVMGCYSQMSPEEVLAIEGVDIVLGSSGRSLIPLYLENYLANGLIQNRIIPVQNQKDYEELKVGRLTGHTRGFIKIQDGCENFCSYCRIPYARGPIRSRKPDDVLEEIKHLVANGVKEIILAGINTGTYGKDLGNITLASMIDRIFTEIPALLRIRLSSIELMEVNDELLGLFDKYPERLAKHLHIPLQAGSETVLQRMKRKYTINDYFKRVREIQNRFSGIAITTDCLAGFVGETEAEFQEAKDFITRMEFAMMHIFPYSRREGTLADQMEGHLPKPIIEERTKAFLELAKTLRKNYVTKMLGTKQHVLFEQKKQGYWIGHSSNYIEVVVLSDEELGNQMVEVELTKTDGEKCIGKIIKVVG